MDNPHDRFFKETFSRTDVLTDFLRLYLPEPIRQGLDLTSLRHETDSYTDEQLGQHFADLVFSARFNEQPVRVTLLLEHKSYPSDHIHLQLNRYMLNVWDDQLKQKQPLTPVLPVVVYHGSRKWRKRTFTAYFKRLNTDLLTYQPAFDYVLIDLSVAAAQLPRFATDYARLTTLLLQNSRRQASILRVLSDYADLLRRMTEESTGQQYVETAFIYLYWATDLTKTEVIAIFQRISIKTGEIAMSTAQRLINEGIEQGIEQGIGQGVELGIERGVRGMLKLGMDAVSIAAAFDMPIEQIKQLIEKINRERA